MTDHDNFIRIAALSHEALGITRVKVIFREGGRDNIDGAEAAYFMDRDIYREFPLGVDVTLAEYSQAAKDHNAHVDEAQNVDIYSNQ